MKDLIQYTARNCIQRANSLYGTSVPDPVIAYERDTGAMIGKAEAFVDGKYNLYFSVECLERDLDWMLEEIVPHEVAHLIDFWMCFHWMDIEEIHNSRWKDIAVRLGSSGSTFPEYIM